MGLLFLELEEVLEIHRDQIALYGGSEGLRDLGLLQSAVAMPQAGFGDQYFHADLYEMAAAYLFHLASNHPFLDGNKRTAAMSAFTFLKMNGIILTASERAFETLVREVAEGKADKKAIAAFFRKNGRQSKVR